ncbi:DNA-binding response regulator [Phaeocystidibacter marisrubri]|uniref:Response regulator transcription factor n=2 Tax=Phaeocystidibacter marisrubri TaxID=1577780 RepID=A0A6L3ZFU0_9FLAO|nr:response regulator transcription factor [Phaeocystidibacter marisrubri]GGH69738.1 DNA-binding response regulator [Phaeocystidibacter marisrubri]
MSMKKVIIADDHPVIAYALEPVLKSIGFESSLVITDLHQIIKAIKTDTPDLLILDVDFHNVNSLDVTKHIHTLWPDLPIVIYTMHRSPVVAKQFLAVGVSGFINKTTDFETLKEAVLQVMAGKRYFDNEILISMVNYVEGSEKLRSLSNREFLIYYAVVRGKSYKDIADEMNISINTVGSYKTKISSKLNLFTKKEWRELAYYNGVIQQFD